MRIVASLFVLLYLGACAPQLIPQKGDLVRTNAYRAELRALLEGGALDSKAMGANLDRDALPPGLDIDTMKISPKQYEGVVHYTLENGLDGSKSDLAYDCESSTRATVVYASYAAGTSAADPGDYKLTLRDGECIQMLGKKIEFRVAIFNFDGPLSAQVPVGGRRSSMDFVLPWGSGMGGWRTQNDKLIWEDAGMLVGESAGYIWRDGSSPIPHLLSSGGADNNYYQIILVGERSIVDVDVVAPLFMPLKEIQGRALPIIKALRYIASPGTPAR